MFVKVICWKVEKDENEVVRKRELDIEHVYDCFHASLSPAKPESGLYANEMNLVLEFNKDDSGYHDRTISFPANRERDDNQVIEIIYMNNSGKTIDRYIY